MSFFPSHTSEGLLNCLNPVTYFGFSSGKSSQQLNLVAEQQIEQPRSFLSVQTWVLVLITLVLLVLHNWPVWDRRRYPPGPWPLPFVGHSHWFYTSTNVFKRIYELKKKYGEVVTLHVGNGKVVVLNSAEAIYDGFVKNSAILSDRPEIMRNPATNGYGLVHEKNGRWKDLRKHALAVFRQHGLGNQGMESIIQDEMKFFFQAIEKLKGQPVDIRDQLTQTISNILTYVVFGSRFDYSDEQLENLQITDFRDIFEKTKYVPFVRNLPYDPSGYQAAKRRHEAGLKFAFRQVEEHKKVIDYDNPRDYIDHYLVEMRRRSADPNTEFTESNLMTSVMSLYLAGTDTTSSQLYWAFLYAVLHPEIQTRIYSEIKEHIGQRTVMYADRTKMNYTMSVITELFRIGIALTTLQHLAAEDVVVRGQKIPKGTPVYANVWGPLHDPQLYPDPEKFIPDRFLNQNGVFVKPDSKHFTAFSAGKRVCLGETLARTEVFLMVVSTLQRYRVSLGQEHLPSDTGTRRFVWLPADRYKVVFTPR